jgi:hypothetical protein
MARTHGETPTWVAIEFLPETVMSVKMNKRRRWLVPTFFIVIVGWAVVGSFMDMPQRLVWNLLGILFAAFVGHNVLTIFDDNRKERRPATRQSDDEHDGGDEGHEGAGAAGR